MENHSGLRIADKEDRSIALKHKSQRLCLTLNDKQTEGIKQIRYEDASYNEVVLAWLAACIRYTSLQPELRKELCQFVRYIQRKF